MRIFFLVFFVLLLISCAERQNSQLELNFTSSNGDTIKEIKSFYLTDLPIQGIAKNIGFHDIKCITPNKFVFNSLKNGTYIGLLQIEMGKSIYNISIDSITISDGRNVISKEINLGYIKL